MASESGELTWTTRPATVLDGGGDEGGTGERRRRWERPTKISDMKKKSIKKEN